MKMKKAINPKVWAPNETARLCGLYAYFLDCQLQGVKYQKAGPVRIAMADLGRTRGSIEAKLMNISACLVALGHPSLVVKGYKPLSNYSTDMLDIVKAGFAPYMKKAA
jgi:hypothetical protein